MEGFAARVPDAGRARRMRVGDRWVPVRRHAIGTHEAAWVLGVSARTMDKLLGAGALLRDAREPRLIHVGSLVIVAEALVREGQLAPSVLEVLGDIVNGRRVIPAAGAPTVRPRAPRDNGRRSQPLRRQGAPSPSPTVPASEPREARRAPLPESVELLWCSRCGDSTLRGQDEISHINPSCSGRQTRALMMRLTFNLAKVEPCSAP